VSILSEPNGLLLVVLPPGAFIGLAVLIAMRNFLAARRAGKPEQLEPERQSVAGKAL
jgi:electron transport complex protein RnfE